MKIDNIIKEFTGMKEMLEEIKTDIKKVENDVNKELENKNVDEKYKEKFSGDYKNKKDGDIKKDEQKKSVEFNVIEVKDNSADNN